MTIKSNDIVCITGSTSIPAAYLGSYAIVTDSYGDNAVIKLKATVGTTGSLLHTALKKDLKKVGIAKSPALDANDNGIWIDTPKLDIGTVFQITKTNGRTSELLARYGKWSIDEYRMTNQIPQYIITAIEPDRGHVIPCQAELLDDLVRDGYAEICEA